MTSTRHDPLIARMDIQRRFALHESCHRLRQLHPQYPRTYGVAVLADVNKRRWYPLDSVFTLDRLRTFFDDTTAATDRRAAGNVLGARLVHEVLGRMLPLVLCEGRAWDAGLENLWFHFDRDNDIDWAAIVDPTVRMLPDDPWIAEKRGGDTDTVVVLPSELALTTWVAHRCHRTLAPLFVWLHSTCDGAISIPSMWQMVGSTIVMAESQLARDPGTDEASVVRRSQAMLDAMVGFGLPVRGPVTPARRLTMASNWAPPREPAAAGRRLRYAGTGASTAVSPPSGGTRVART